MADGDNAPLPRHGTDESLAAGKLGRNRDEQDRARKSLGQPRYERRVGRPHGFGWVAARITIARVEERSFEVIARDHDRPEPASRDGPVQSGEAGLELIVRSSDQG